MTILRKLKNHLFPSKTKNVQTSHFYKFSPTCQISDLNIIYEQYFDRRTDGCFVEVGAFDGEYASNTSGLADIGWLGFYIEPVPRYFEKCFARHRDNKNITVGRHAIGPKKGKVTMNVGGALSTISDEMRENFESLDWAKESFQREKIEVEQITLENFFIKNKVKKKV